MEIIPQCLSNKMKREYQSQRCNTRWGYDFSSEYCRANNSNVAYLSSSKVKKKRQSCPATSMQTTTGEDITSYLFLTSVVDGGEWSASRPSHALPPGKEPRYPLDRRLGDLQSWSGHRGLKKNPLPPPRFEPRSPDSLVCSHIYWAK
jgi:hypothetical protein